MGAGGSSWVWIGKMFTLGPVGAEIPLGSSIPRGIDSGRGTGRLVLMLASPKRCKDMQSSRVQMACNTFVRACKDTGVWIAISRQTWSIQEVVSAHVGSTVMTTQGLRRYNNIVIIIINCIALTSAGMHNRHRSSSFCARSPLVLQVCTA